jgi:molybdate transport system substrate-binding protein
VNKSPSISRAAAVTASLLICILTHVATGAEIKVLAGSAIIPVMKELIPKFEQSSGHTIKSDFNGTIGAMAARVHGGEVCDVIIVSARQIDMLGAEDKVAAGSRADIAKVGVGVFVQKGAPRPDIASVDAFKRTMLAARSVGWNDPGAGAPVGIYMVGLLQRLGIAEEMKPKIVAFKQRSERFEAVARGDVEIGFNQVSEILAAEGVELVGPLPAEIQDYTPLAAGIVNSGNEKDGGVAFVRFITSPSAQEIWKAKGFEAP